MDIYKLLSVPDRPPANPGCFVVLSYAVEDKVSPTSQTRAIIDLAIRWWKEFPKSYIIMSTGDNQNLGVSNSTVMAAYAVRMGVPKSRIIEENQSKDTYQNLVYSREITRKMGIRNPTYVTYDLHTRRMLRIARKLGMHDIYYISAGGKGSPAYGIKALQTYSRLTVFIYEILAHIYNLIRGEL